MRKMNRQELAMEIYREHCEWVKRSVSKQNPDKLTNWQKLAVTLAALPPESITPQLLAQEYAKRGVIYDDGPIQCHECRDYFDEVICFDIPGDEQDIWHFVCANCLTEAIRILK